MASQTEPTVSLRRRCRSLRRLIALLAAVLIGSMTPAVGADEVPAGRTPPRLSRIDGEVSFWRPNQTDWERARLNTALAPGDYLYCQPNSRFELQIGARAFLRAAGETQLSLETQEPDFLQFKATTGRVTLDLRTIDRGHSIELDTPSAAFTFDRVGYFRVDIDTDQTRFITRRGGHAAVTPAGGQAVEVEPSEIAVITDGDTPHVATDAAPAIDDWDRWNFDRTDRIVDSLSDRYVPAGMYGIADLDQYGTWEVMPTYGRVWVPADVGPDWAPYSTGSWLNDPYYGWTWVDDAPWGWAPYHYGRWVNVNSGWAWAPGPLAAAVPPIYSPALVAFFGPHLRPGVGFPIVSWVALGWGEPLFPWWGPRLSSGHPWWGGWCGPHGGDHWDHPRFYQNFGVHNAVVTVRREQFHSGTFARVNNVAVHDLQPVHGTLPIKPGLSAAGMHIATARPPARLMNRPVVTARRISGAPPLSTRVGAVSPALAAPIRMNNPGSRGIGPQWSSNRPSPMQPPPPPHSANYQLRASGSNAGTFSVAAPHVAQGTFSAPSGPTRFGPTTYFAPPHPQANFGSRTTVAPYRAPVQNFARVQHFGAAPHFAGHAGSRGGARGHR